MSSPGVLYVPGCVRAGMQAVLLFAWFAPPRLIAHTLQHVAGHHPDVRLLGISTVAGNSSLKNVTANALAAVEASGLSNVRKMQGKSEVVNS